MLWVFSLPLKLNYEYYPRRFVLIQLHHLTDILQKDIDVVITDSGVKEDIATDIEKLGPLVIQA